jgi:hypothetical protein
MKPMIPGTKMTELYTALFTAFSIPVVSSPAFPRWLWDEFVFSKIGKQKLVVWVSDLVFWGSCKLY